MSASKIIRRQQTLPLKFNDPTYSDFRVTIKNETWHLHKPYLLSIPYIKNLIDSDRILRQSAAQNTTKEALSTDSTPDSTPESKYDLKSVTLDSPILDPEAVKICIMYASYYEEFDLRKLNPNQTLNLLDAAEYLLINDLVALCLSHFRHLILSSRNLSETINLIQMTLERNRILESEKGISKQTIFAALWDFEKTGVNRDDGWKLDVPGFGNLSKKTIEYLMMYNSYPAFYVIVKWCRFNKDLPLLMTYLKSKTFTEIYTRGQILFKHIKILSGSFEDLEFSKLLIEILCSGYIH